MFLSRSLRADQGSRIFDQWGGCSGQLLPVLKVLRCCEPSEACLPCNGVSESSVRGHYEYVTGRRLSKDECTHQPNLM